MKEHKYFFNIKTLNAPKKCLDKSQNLGFDFNKSILFMIC